MAARRVTFLLILLLFATWNSIAQASQVGIPVSSTGKGLLDGETAAATNGKNWVGGRKMNLKVMIMRGTAVGETSASKFSSANSKRGNHDIATGCEEQSVCHFSHHHDEVEDHDHDQSAGFVAFNADYHAPRHHPPKNN